MLSLLYIVFCTMAYSSLSFAAELHSPINSDDLSLDGLIQKTTVQKICEPAGASIGLFAFAGFFWQLFVGKCWPIPVSNDCSCLAEYEVRTHLDFSVATALTTGGYCLTASYLSGQYKKYKDRPYLITTASNFTKKIGKGAQLVGKGCIASGAPLLWMSLSWGEGALYQNMEANLVCGNQTVAPNDTISQEVGASKIMTLAGSVLTTIGTASWLIGKRLTG